MTAGTFCQEQIGNALHHHSRIEAKRQALKSKEQPKQKVIILAGPTGVGKSEFAIKLAKALNGEIIAADSMQVYRGMDIGTAKATKAQRLEISHHLLDIRDVTDPMNVVDFYHEACFCLHTVHERAGVGIVVGGSGFYLHALLYGPPLGPPASPEIRSRLDEEAERLGLDFLYDKLVTKDPEYAQTVTPHDRHKVVRALEIMEVSGKKVSSFDWKQKPLSSKYDFRCWFLHRERQHLYHRIERRCHKMIEEGLLEEVRQLEKKGLRHNISAAQAIGYRQSLNFLDSPQTPEDYRQFVEKFIHSSRQYAKRQHTWFKKEPGYKWLDIDAHDYENALEIIMNDFEGR